MATVRQAAKQLIVESTAAVVTQVAKSSAGDLKTIESSVVKEAVSATDKDAPSLEEKAQDGIAVVATELAKGAQSAVVAVEQHPELIAEGALAVAIGAASLVQPELAAGEVALVGKMAADSAKKTVTTIASTTGSNVVKAISKDIAGDAKKEAAKDVEAKAGEDKGDRVGKEKALIPEASDPNAVSVDKVKAQLNDDAPLTDSKATLASDTPSKDKTIAIEVAQEPVKVGSSGGASPQESKPEPAAAAPVSLKITLGSDGEVKAVTKGDVEQKIETADPIPAAEPAISKTSPAQTTKTATVSTEVAKEKAEAVPEVPVSAPQPTPIPEKTPQNALEVPQSIENTPTVPSQAVISASATVTKAGSISNTSTDDLNLTAKGQMVTVSQESLELLYKKIDAMHEAIQQITKVLAFHMPTPVPVASGSKFAENVEEIINEALATAVKPLTELVPEITPTNNNNTPLPMEDSSAPKSPPKRPSPEKRTSVLGSIGKAFWPFGSSEKVATVTITEVSDTADVVV